jgi:pseudaminic acid synthase
MGTVDYEMSDKKRKSREFSRSLFVVQDVEENEELTDKNIRSIRPGYGMHPKFYHKVLGKRFVSDVQKGTPLSEDMFY